MSENTLNYVWIFKPPVLSCDRTLLKYNVLVSLCIYLIFNKIQELLSFEDSLLNEWIWCWSCWPGFPLTLLFSFGRQNIWKYICFILLNLECTIFYHWRLNWVDPDERLFLCSTNGFRKQEFTVRFIECKAKLTSIFGWAFITQ